MSFGQTVLVVEDDEELRSLLGRGLREEGFAVEAVATGAAALARVAEGEPDVLVVDIGLPDADGRDLCQACRSRSRSPISSYVCVRCCAVQALTARSRQPAFDSTRSRTPSVTTRRKCR